MPLQPTQDPDVRWSMGVNAETRPPGLGLQARVSSEKATGRRLAMITTRRLGPVTSTTYRT